MFVWNRCFKLELLTKVETPSAKQLSWNGHLFRITDLWVTDDVYIYILCIQIFLSMRQISNHSEIMASSWGQTYWSSTKRRTSQAFNIYSTWQYQRKNTNTRNTQNFFIVLVMWVNMLLVDFMKNLIFFPFHFLQ